MVCQKLCGLFAGTLRGRRSQVSEQPASTLLLLDSLLHYWWVALHNKRRPLLRECRTSSLIREQEVRFLVKATDVGPYQVRRQMESYHQLKHGFNQSTWNLKVWDTNPGYRDLLRGKVSRPQELIKSTDLSAPSEPARCVVTQGFPSILWKPKVYCRVHESPPVVSILSQINPSYLTKIHLTVFHPRLGRPSGLFPSGFPTSILYAFISRPHPHALRNCLKSWSAHSSANQ
jgi:hypothetical protein